MQIYVVYSCYTSTVPLPTYKLQRNNPHTVHKRSGQTTSIRKNITSETILHKLVNRIPELVIVINLVIDLIRNPCISSNHPNFPLFRRPRIRITTNPQTSRHANHNHASTHIRRTPEVGPPRLGQHLPHLHNGLMIPLLDPLNAAVKPVNKLNSGGNHQLGTIIPGPNPSTLHSQAIAILMRHHRVVQIRNRTLRVPASVQKRNGRWTKEPLMQITSVKISTNLLHINIGAPNGMCSVDENLVHAFLPANLNQLLHGNNDARHGRERDLDDVTSRTCDVGLHGFLNGAVSVVEHEDDVAFLESSFAEVPGSVLEHDGGGGGGVVHDGDLVDVVGVDEGSRLEDSSLEDVEVEVVRLAEVVQLPPLLLGQDGGGAAPEAAVVDARHGGVMVAEFRFDFGGSYEGELRLFGYVRAVVMVVFVDVVIGGGSHWDRRL
ncbi:hypothetical protein CR513_00420, partial [Mucuna pruriens]